MTDRSASLLTPPSKTNLLGMGVSRTNYQECTDFIIQCAQLGQSCTVAPTPVHGIMTGYLDPKGHGYRLNHFTIVAQDGQPVRWAINLLRKPNENYLRDRVYGPTLMLHLCERAARENISIFLYGSRLKVIEDLQLNLKKKFPNLKFAGAISPPFRSLTPEEDAEYIKHIRESGAGIVFIGLGCPRQEKWAFENSDRLNCALVCVGAAFDFHAGNVPQAPPWMQKMGFEWLFRFLQEPNRLWKRYLLLNPLYLILLFLQLIKLLPKRDFSQEQKVDGSKVN
jgi:exopolysaccharide biosynthesis WecB/TagA/CpsF family protein